MATRIRDSSPSSRTRKGYRKCVRCGNNRNVRRYVGTRGRVCDTCRKGRVRNQSKDQRLQETYGITLEEWNKILAAQGGVCAICKGKRSTYDTDHDHRLERELRAAGYSDLEARRYSVRGLLCRRCNRRLLPAATDSADVLEEAIGYLHFPPAPRLIERISHDPA